MRLLVADRVKGSGDSFMRPLLPVLRQHFDVRLVSLPPGDELAAAIREADIVWLEWCWDHAVWATRSPTLLTGKPTVLRLHSIEVLGPEFPDRIAWRQIDRVITVGPDIHDLLLQRYAHLAGRLHMIPNGVDLAKFKPGTPDAFHVAWVGHIEPKKNPMLLLQIAQQLHGVDARYRFRVAGAFTDLRTVRYLESLLTRMNLPIGILHFDGVVSDMPGWYADKGILLSTSMYESFGMNIGEAMATGAFPVVHCFPGAERLWPEECLFATVPEAVQLICNARPGLYRDWVCRHYSLERQAAATLAVLRAVAEEYR